MEKMSRKEIFIYAHKQTKKEVKKTKGNYHKTLGVFLKALFHMQRNLKRKAVLILTKHKDGKKILEKVSLNGTYLECQNKAKTIMNKYDLSTWERGFTNSTTESYIYKTNNNHVLGVHIMEVL